MTVHGRTGIALTWVCLSGCLGGTPGPAIPPYPAGAELEITAMGRPLMVHWKVDDGISGDTCAARRVRGRLARDSGDTLWFRASAMLVEDSTSGTSAACSRAGMAVVVTVPDSIQVMRIVPVSVPKQVLGTAILAAAVGATLLLLVSATDGVIDAVGRWF